MKKNITNVRSGMLGEAILHLLFILVLAAIVTSCNNAKPKDTKEVAEDLNDAKFDNSRQAEEKEADANFLVAAAEINLEEIQLGQLAQNKSAMAEVKDLGKMMESEHKNALHDLQALAAQKKISIPSTLTDNGKDANETLMKKSGADFDKEYCELMVSGHKKAIDKFQKASTDATDPDIRNWAIAMLPALRAHLGHAVDCLQKCQKM